MLFIFAFLSSRDYWVEKSLNTFGFKNINLSMHEVWIDSEIQIYSNNNNQTKYYRSWRVWLGGGGAYAPLLARATGIFPLFKLLNFTVNQIHTQSVCGFVHSLASNDCFKHWTVAYFFVYRYSRWAYNREGYRVASIFMLYINLFYIFLFRIMKIQRWFAFESNIVMGRYWF